MKKKTYEVINYNRHGQVCTINSHMANYSPYFKPWELASRETESEKATIRFHYHEPLQGGFLNWLCFLRMATGKPFIINSACRSLEHNKAVGGHPRSLHLMDNPVHPTNGTMAVDISVAGWSNGEIKKLLDTAMSPLLGFSVGRGEKKGFIHVDMRTWIGLPQHEFYY